MHSDRMHIRGHPTGVGAQAVHAHDPGQQDEQATEPQSASRSGPGPIVDAHRFQSKPGSTDGLGLVGYRAGSSRRPADCPTNSATLTAEQVERHRGNEGYVSADVSPGQEVTVCLANEHVHPARVRDGFDVLDVRGHREEVDGQKREQREPDRLASAVVI